MLVAVGLAVLGLYLPPVFAQTLTLPGSTPDNHFAASPDCRVLPSSQRPHGGAGGCPTVGAGIVSAAGVQVSCSWQIRPRRSFHCRSTPPCESYRPAGAPVVLVAVQLLVLGLYLPPVLK